MPSIFTLDDNLEAGLRRLLASADRWDAVGARAIQLLDLLQQTLAEAKGQGLTITIQITKQPSTNPRETLDLIQKGG